MIYKEFGKTGIKVSAVGFGGMRFKNEEFADGDYSKCAELLINANKMGINYFDTAPGYCKDKSQAIFGAAFKNMKRENFYVSSKCSLWTAKNSDEVRKLILSSLETLNIDYLDFYNCWCIKTMDEYHAFFKPDGIYEGIVKAKDEGLVRHICFTTHMDGESIAKVANDGYFEGVTLGYNAVNFAFRQKGIDACHKAGMGVVTMNPLGGGLIPRHPDYFSFIKNGDDSLAVSALKFIVSQKQTTVALAGISSMEELYENLKAGENVTPATDDYLDKMAQNLNRNLNTLCTGCGYCDDCPAGIPIPKLMDSYNEFVLSKGDVNPVFNRLDYHWGISKDEAAKCIACGKCESLCTQKLPIIARLAEFAGFEKK